MKKITSNYTKVDHQDTMEEDKNAEARESQRGLLEMEDISAVQASADVPST